MPKVNCQEDEPRYSSCVQQVVGGERKESMRRTFHGYRQELMEAWARESWGGDKNVHW